MSTTTANTKTTSCVLRPINGEHDVQYVPIADAVVLTPGERVFTGVFSEQVEHVGPSKSHPRTVCLPVGKLTEAVVSECVLREVRPGDTQYRPVKDVDARTLVPGEASFIGLFRTIEENNGPYGSHKMLIALPVGEVRKSTLQAAAA